MIIMKPQVDLLYITPDAEQFIESAGRTCYKSEDKITAQSASNFVKMLLSRGHESVLEHGVASFKIMCDRGVSHEIVRHRLASYSQESTRYCDYKNQITVIEPPIFDDTIKALWLKACEYLEHVYIAMRAYNISPQIARSILPNCLKTEIVMTCNFREWRHFLKLRTSTAAHPQMREIAEMIKKILYNQYPNIFDIEDQS